MGQFKKKFKRLLWEKIKQAKEKDQKRRIEERQQRINADLEKKNVSDRDDFESQFKNIVHGFGKDDYWAVKNQKPLQP